MLPDAGRIYPLECSESLPHHLPSVLEFVAEEPAGFGVRVGQRIHLGMGASPPSPSGWGIGKSGLKETRHAVAKGCSLRRIPKHHAPEGVFAVGRAGHADPHLLVVLGEDLLAVAWRLHPPIDDRPCV